MNARQRMLQPFRNDPFPTQVQVHKFVSRVVSLVLWDCAIKPGPVYNKHHAATRRQ